MFGKFPSSNVNIRGRVNKPDSNGTTVIVCLTSRHRKTAVETKYFGRVYCSAVSKDPEQNYNVSLNIDDPVTCVFFIPDGAQVFPDDRIHVEILAQIRYEGIDVMIPSGHSSIMLRDVIDQGKEYKFEVPIVLISANDVNADDVDRDLGMMHWMAKTTKKISFTHAGPYDLEDSNRSERNEIMLTEAVDANKHIMPSSRLSNLKLRPLYDELSEVRLTFEFHPLGTIPAHHYFEMAALLPAEHAVLERMLEYAIRRSSINMETFIKTLSSYNGGKLTKVQFDALDVCMQAVTILPLALHYIPDVAVRNRVMVIVEYFNHLTMLRKSADCEDKTYVAAWIFFCAIFTDESKGTPQFKIWRSVLRQYVPIYILMSVIGGKHGDGSELEGIPDVSEELPADNQGAHMAFGCVDKQYFLESLKMARLPHGVVHDEDGYVSDPNRKKWPMLAGEGTGDMCAFVDTFEGVLGEKGDDVLFSYNKTLAAAISPSTDFSGNQISVNPDPRMSKWGYRSYVPDTGRVNETAMTTRFYRTIVCIGVASPYAGKLVRLDVEYQKGKFGMPYLAMARGHPMKLIPWDGYSPKAFALIKRMERHTPLDHPIQMPKDLDHIAYVEKVKKAFEKVVNKTKKTSKSFVLTRSCDPEPTIQEIRDFSSFVRDNKYIVGVEIWSETFDGLGNVCMRLYI
jgi:hypothetical protein